MPDAYDSNTGVIQPLDVLLFVRPAGNGAALPFPYKSTAASFIDTMLQIAMQGEGIPVSPDGTWRLQYDPNPAAPLTPKLRLVINGLCVVSVDNAGNITTQGTLNGETTP